MSPDPGREVVAVAVTRRTFQASDLAGTGRREFLDRAKAGEAHWRDTNGTPLVMVPAAALDGFRNVNDWVVAYLGLGSALRRPCEEREPGDFGGVAWAATLNDDDLREMCDDLGRALVVAFSQRDVGAGATGVAWSGDGRRLASVAAAHETWDLDGCNDLWVVDVSAGPPTRLSDTTMSWSHPSWSPEGDLIAVLAVPDPSSGPRHGQLWVVDAGGGRWPDPDGGRPRPQPGSIRRVPAAGVGR